MNQPSAFQAQNPLSPRKFWKKMFGTIITYIVILVLCTGTFLFTTYAEVGDPTGPQIVHWLGLGFLVFLVLYFIIVLLKAWYFKVYINRYYYDCGDQFVTIKKGVFMPSEIHVQYQKIQDVYVDQDLLDRIMGLYDVHIASATVTSGIEAHIDGVDAAVAENLKNVLLGKIHSAGQSQAAQQNQTQPLQTSQPQSNPVQFSQKISSDTYPVSSSWVVSVIASSFLYALIYTLIFARLLVLLDLVFSLVIFGVFFFGRIIWQSIWKQNYYFEFTPEYLLLRTGVISRSENHLPYKAIQNVINRQGIVDRIFGMSTVVIQNAAQQMIQTRQGQSSIGVGISLVWQPYAKAEELTNILNDITSKINPQNSSSMGV